MRGLKFLIVGAVTSVVLQYWLVIEWRAWFDPGGAHAPWFMNSGRSVAVTIAAFAIAGGLASITGRQPAIDGALLASLSLAVGGAIPMVTRLFTMPGGPGDLFPIAIAIGFVLLLFGSAIGVLTAWWIRQEVGARTQ